MAALLGLNLIGTPIASLTWLPEPLWSNHDCVIDMDGAYLSAESLLTIPPEPMA